MIDFGEKKFGFGGMRLPVTDPSDGTSFDYDLINSMVDAFIEAGFCYFDTAYTYHGYRAEEAFRKALVERHSRESFKLATKLPLRDFKDRADMDRILARQLENCGVDYFDAYLLHNIGSNVYGKCCEHGAFDFMRGLKERGLARSIGFSFHDTPELLERVVDENGEGFDFVQLQVNYADWEQVNVQSRRCLEAAREHGLPVVVMEPCKGGTLVNLPEAAATLMRDAAPDAPVASWALRFAASQPGVAMVLSGMNTLEQLRENMAAFSPLVPLDGAEDEVICQVRGILAARQDIACTACAYCTHDCPQHIAIPRMFGVYNSLKSVTGSFSSQQVYYNNIVEGGSGRAGDCIRCGLCEDACPQHLPIRELLETVSARFDGAALPGQEK